MHEIRRLLNTKQFAAALQRAEAVIYQAAYHHTGYNQSVAAKLLGVSRGTFRSRLKEWDG